MEQQLHARLSLRFFSDPTRERRCTRAIIQRYLSKVNGPLLDRIDLHIEVPSVPYKELRGNDHGVTSAEMPVRVDAARAIQQERGFNNAHILPVCSEACVRSTRRGSVRSRWRCGAWPSARVPTIAF